MGYTQYCYTGSRASEFTWNTDCFKKAIKEARLKGVTVRKDHSSSYTFTIKMKESDLVPLDEVQPYLDYPKYAWLDYYNENGKLDHLKREDWFRLSDEDKHRVFVGRKKVINEDLHYSYGLDLFHGDLEGSRSELKHYIRDEVIQKIKKVADIAYSFYRDDSDAMIDYFDTNFYWTIRLKAEGV